LLETKSAVMVAGWIQFATAGPTIWIHKATAGSRNQVSPHVYSAIMISAGCGVALKMF